MPRMSTMEAAAILAAPPSVGGLDAEERDAAAEELFWAEQAMQQHAGAVPPTHPEEPSA